MSDPEFPTQRDVPGFTAEPAHAPELTNVPWIDVHNHAHTLSWDDREKLALSGCEAAITIGAAYYWAPYRPVRAEDVRSLWDEALARTRPIERSHLFEVKLGLGVHTWSRVENVEALLASLPGYLELDVVAAVGEIGVTKSQHVHEWNLDAQREVVTEQMRIAEEYDTPVILHTPPTLNEGSVIGSRMPVYEVDLELLQEPVLNEEGTSLQGTKIDVECARAAGLPDEKVVVSHADPTITEYVMESTDCYLSFTVGYPWLTGVTAADVADAIETHGPDRIMIDTDCAGVIKSDPFAIKRSIFELHRRGIDTDDIRRVVHENPRDVFF